MCKRANDWTPAKLPPQEINFSDDALFDFDKAALRAEGKAMLDDLVLQGANSEVILAVGHTDRNQTHLIRRSRCAAPKP